MSAVLSESGRGSPRQRPLPAKPTGRMSAVLMRGKGLRPFPHTPFLACPSVPPLRSGQVSLDEAEHLFHNRDASVAALRGLFAFGPECRSRSLRNHHSPSPESSPAAAGSQRLPERSVYAHQTPPQEPARRATARPLDGRVGRPRRIFQVQNNPKPLRCRAITVSGITITRADRQPAQTPGSHAHRMRSAAVSFGRFLAARWRTPIWWREARISS